MRLDSFRPCFLCLTNFEKESITQDFRGLQRLEKGEGEGKVLLRPTKGRLVCPGKGYFVYRLPL